MRVDNYSNQLFVREWDTNYGTKKINWQQCLYFITSHYAYLQRKQSVWARTWSLFKHSAVYRMLLIPGRSRSEIGRIYRIVGLVWFCFVYWGFFP